jgi:hypothetical protein
MWNEIRPPSLIFGEGKDCYLFLLGLPKVMGADEKEDLATVALCTNPYPLIPPINSPNQWSYTSATNH